MTKDDLRRCLAELHEGMANYGSDKVLADAADGGYRYFSVAEVNGQRVTISLDIDAERLHPFRAEDRNDD